MKYFFTIIMLFLTSSIAVLTYFGMKQDPIHFPIILVVIGEFLMCCVTGMMYQTESKQQKEKSVSHD